MSFLESYGGIGGIVSEIIGPGTISNVIEHGSRGMLLAPNETFSEGKGKGRYVKINEDALSERQLREDWGNEYGGKEFTATYGETGNITNQVGGGGDPQTVPQDPNNLTQPPEEQTTVAPPPEQTHPANVSQFNPTGMTNSSAAQKQYEFLMNLGSRHATPAAGAAAVKQFSQHLWRTWVHQAGIGNQEYRRRYQIYRHGAGRALVNYGITT